MYSICQLENKVKRSKSQCRYITKWRYCHRHGRVSTYHCACLKFTGETDAIVTLGIKPNRPETGYGYIQADLSVSSPRNKGIFRVDSFREKPDIATAKKYIQQNNYFWNAGIFIWNVSTIVNAFRVYQAGNFKGVWRRWNIFIGSLEEQQMIDETLSRMREYISRTTLLWRRQKKFLCAQQTSDGVTLETWGQLVRQK